MISYNFLNPGVFLILAGIILNFIPKKLYKTSVLACIALSYLSFITNKWNVYNPASLLFSDMHILFILTSIFFLVLFVSVLLAFFSKDKISVYISLFFIYVGSTIAILFTKNLLYILFFLEIMMLAAVFIIFSKKDTLSKKEGLNYFKFHMFGGTLLLAGVMSYYFKNNSLDIDLLNKNNFYTLSSSLLLVGLLVNLAVPPFSSWLLGGYSVVPSYASIILAVCTTKISALLLMKIFSGLYILIPIGIITASYGILFSLFDNNIKRTILYIIIAELGILLIFIGANENNSNAALIAIINDLLCVPIILCSAQFVIYFFKKEKMTEIKNTLSNTVSIIFLTSEALFSLAALPFSLGYESKRYLYTSRYFANSDWLPHIMGIISVGIILSLCFRFMSFVFLKRFSLSNITKNSKNRLNTKEYYSYIFALGFLCIGLITFTAYFISKSSKPVILYNYFLLHQIEYVLIAGVVFFIIKKYLIYNQNILTLDPNIRYLIIGNQISIQFTKNLKHLYTIANNIRVYLSDLQKNSLLYIKNRSALTQEISLIIILIIVIFLIILYPLGG